MTALDANDFDYEPTQRPSSACGSKADWDVAFGLQAVDGLKPSSYMRALAAENVQGIRDLHETGEAVRSYYHAMGTASHVNAGEEQADLVSQRIVEVLSLGEGSFALSPEILPFIHAYLFQDLNDEVFHPGEFKTEALQKREAILNGDSVLYADPVQIERSLRFLFSEESSAVYSPSFDEGQLKHFAKFIARVWQVHPFCEGNTRTVAVFSTMYLQWLGFDVDNAPFAEYAVFFRNALVRANYRNARAGVMPDHSYLVHFLDAVLNGVNGEFEREDLSVRALFEDPMLLRNVDPSRAIEKGNFHE